MRALQVAFRFSVLCSEIVCESPPQRKGRGRGRWDCLRVELRITNSGSSKIIFGRRGSSASTKRRAKMSCAPASHLTPLVHAAQRDSKRAIELEVTAPDQRHILGYPQSGVKNCCHRANCDRVIAAKNPCG